MSGNRIAARWHVSALVLALLFACLPLLNDICRLGCEQPQASACPLHGRQPAPERCAHDHSTPRANLVGAVSVVPVFAALPFDRIGRTGVPARHAVETDGSDRWHAPPNRAACTAVLRI